MFARESDWDGKMWFLDMETGLNWLRCFFSESREWASLRNMAVSKTLDFVSHT